MKTLRLMDILVELELVSVILIDQSCHLTQVRSTGLGR